MIKILPYNVNANDNEEGRCVGVQCAKRTKSWARQTEKQDMLGYVECEPLHSLKWQPSVRYGYVTIDLSTAINIYTSDYNMKTYACLYIDAHYYLLMPYGILSSFRVESLI